MRTAFEHFRVVCCLDLPREVALMAVAEAVRGVVASDWARLGIIAPDGSYRAAFAENPAFYDIGFPAWWEHEGEGDTPPTLFKESFLARRCGVFLDRQHRYASTACHAASERPCDAWWLLDAFADLGDGEVCAINLLRSRLRKPFESRDDSALRRVTPWIAHALKQRPILIQEGAPADDAGAGMPPFIEGSALLAPDQSVVYETTAFRQLCHHCGEAAQRWEALRRRPTNGPTLPARVRTVLARLRTRVPERLPSATVPTRFGPLTIDATLVATPGSGAPDDIRGCPVLVRLALRRHPALVASQALRESGGSPAQVAVGVRLALGETKKQIALKLGVSPTSVEDAARKLYRQLGVHNAAQLAARAWAGPSRPRPN